MPSLKKAIAEGLQRILSEKQLTQKALSEMTHISFQTINGITRGRIGFSADTIEKLAKALEVEETDLVAVQKPTEKVEINKVEWDQIQKALRGIIVPPPQEIPSSILKKLSKLDDTKKQILFEIFEMQLDKALGEEDTKEDCG